MNERDMERLRKALVPELPPEEWTSCREIIRPDGSLMVKLYRRHGENTFKTADGLTMGEWEALHPEEAK